MLFLGRELHDSFYEALDQLRLAFIADPFEGSGHADQFGGALFCWRSLSVSAASRISCLSRERPPATRLHRMYSCSLVRLPGKRNPSPRVRHRASMRSSSIGTPNPGRSRNPAKISHASSRWFRCKFSQWVQSKAPGPGLAQAARTAFQTAGALLSLMRSVPSLNWPFLIRCMSSTPAMVIEAFRKRFKPSIGPKRSLIDR